MPGLGGMRKFRHGCGNHHSVAVHEESLLALLPSFLAPVG